MIELQQLRPCDRDRVTTIMDDVFDDDRLQRWIFGPTMNIGLYFGQAAHALYLHQDCSFVSMDNQAAVLMLKPNTKKQIPIYKMLPLLKPILKHGGLRALKRGIIADEIVSKKAPKHPYYYIFAIGACKTARGKGYGSALMRRCIDIAEADNTPIYLENSKQENLRFYEGHGFEVIEEITIGKGSPPMWLMLRKPQR
jgi:ribosomal protein S18 acetylase RimI-like enzyme